MFHASGYRVLVQRGDGSGGSCGARAGLRRHRPTLAASRLWCLSDPLRAMARWYGLLLALGNCRLGGREAQTCVGGGGTATTAADERPPCGLPSPKRRVVPPQPQDGLDTSTSMEVGVERCVRGPSLLVVLGVGVTSAGRGAARGASSSRPSTRTKHLLAAPADRKCCMALMNSQPGSRRSSGYTKLDQQPCERFGGAGGRSPDGLAGEWSGVAPSRTAETFVLVSSEVSAGCSCAWCGWLVGASQSAWLWWQLQARWQRMPDRPAVR